MGSNICDNCGDEFPTRLEIDGKVRNLSSRRYCLSCSPFGNHNTKQLHDRNEGSERVCDDCGREYVYDKSKGHNLNRCNSCCVKRRRIKRKRELVEESGGECASCGYDNCMQALSFHHRDPNKKEFNVTGSLTTRSWESLIDEVEKCDLLCANCHREEHCVEEH